MPHQVMHSRSSYKRRASASTSMAPEALAGCSALESRGDVQNGHEWSTAQRAIAEISDEEPERIVENMELKAAPLALALAFQSGPLNAQDIQGPSSTRDPLIHGLLHAQSAFHGNLELGGSHGAIPFVQQEGEAWNAFLRGQVSLDIAGIPLSINADLGTDTPQRGQRNRLSIRFEPQRLVKRERLGDAHALHRLDQLLDSLLLVQGGLQRRVDGQQMRLDALEAQLSLAPTDTLGEETQSPLPGKEDLQADSIPSKDELAVLLRSGIEQTSEALSAVEEQVAILKKEKERVAAMSQMHAKNASKGGRFLQGFRRLEIGTCAPRGGTFLLNGTTFQGISAEYMHKELFLSVDHGRSFDESWMNISPLARQVQAFQQSLFLTETADLNPKRLTVVRAGVGATEGTHFHVGYLNGSREDLPPGVWLENATTTLTNHAIEFSGMVELAKRHQLRASFARSILNVPLADPDGRSVMPDVQDLFTTAGSAANAIEVGWRMDLDKSGTLLDLSARSVEPDFVSFGAAFIRQGSRAINARLDQRLGQKLRLRLRYTKEERQFPGASDRPGTLDRGQCMLTYRPLRLLSLRAGYLPVVTRAWAGDTLWQEENSMWNGGASLRKRFGNSVLTLNGDVSLFMGSGLGGHDQNAWNGQADLRWRHQERWSAGVVWNAFHSTSSDSTAHSNNLGISGDMNTPGGLRLQGAIQFPIASDPGILISASQRLSARWTVNMRAERYTNPAVLGWNGQDTSTPMYSSLSITHTW